MTPHRSEAELNDHAEGALPPRQAAEVERHLAECGECRARVERLSSLLAGLAALPREGEPERDLWPALAARIAAEEGLEAAEDDDPVVIPLARRRPPPTVDAALWRAAAAVVLFVGGAGLGRMTATSSPEQTVVTPTTVTQPEPAVATTAAEAAEQVQHAGTAYVAAVAQFTALAGQGDDDAVAQGREAAFKAMYGAAEELTHVSATDTTVAQVFQTVANSLQAEGAPPPAPSAPASPGGVRF